MRNFARGLGGSPSPDQAQADSPPALAGVLFDMDGLLVDTEPIWFEVEISVMARLGAGEWTPADQLELVGGSLAKSVAYMISRAARPADPDEVATWLVDGMAELLATREIEPLPGAVELIGAVRAARLPYALVTSSERVIADAVLGALARRGVRFDVIVCGADVVNPKPDPEPYLLGAKLLEVDPRCCVALEDSPNGVASALAAGCVTVAVPGLVPIEDRPGLHIVGSLAELDLDALRGLVASASLGVFLDECAAR
ncbi:MAG TPA: HAD family phosphatase [Streptosporangiaceae bacterium]|nr:HAD family phosphatase [Streptosporangiaceae bacterium]